MSIRTSILVIDDDEMVRQALGNALESEEYYVVSAANRQEALLRLGKQPIGIVLLDLNPRNEDGWETLHRLHSIQPGLQVIAVTARSEQHDASSRAPGIEALMEKPLNLSVLMQTLNGLTSQLPQPAGPRVQLTALQP